MRSSKLSFSGIRVPFDTLPFAFCSHSNGSSVVALVDHLMGTGGKSWQVGAGHL